MQIREYDGVDEKLPSQPFFTRWFCCMNKACKTTLVMPARYKVDRDNSSDPRLAFDGRANRGSSDMPRRPRGARGGQGGMGGRAAPP